MIELQNILVVVEPDQENQPALDRAAKLALCAQSKLELILADYTPYLESGYYFDPVQAEQLRQQHADDRREYLEKMAAPLREKGLDVSVSTAWGNPTYAEIVSRIIDSEPSLVVKGTRHHNKFARMFISNQDWELIRYCPAPLLLVKEGNWTSHPIFLAAVDPDHMHDKTAELDKKIISSAKSLAAVSGGEVQLFHSSWIPPLSGLHVLVPDLERAQKNLSALAEPHNIATSDCHLSTENIEVSLPKTAIQQKASVVVMGAVSRSFLDRYLIGSTAERVMDEVDCDVLVVKQDDLPDIKPGLL